MGDVLISHQILLNSKRAFRPVYPEKIQKASPSQHLGKIIEEHVVHPQKLETRKDSSQNS